MNVLFFGQIRETLEVDKINIDTPPKTVKALRLLLSQKNDQWRNVLNDKDILVAVNHTLCDDDMLIGKDDEVAFFPPVTGG